MFTVEVNIAVITLISMLYVLTGLKMQYELQSMKRIHWMFFI